MPIKKPEIDLTDLRNLLKEKSIEEVAKIVGFKQVCNFRVFCKRNFISLPDNRGIKKGRTE